MIVTIDGPAGAGKSTAAKALAVRLGFRFLDTGAMYRAVTLAAVRSGLDWDRPDELEELAGNLDIQLDDLNLAHRKIHLPVYMGVGDLHQGSVEGLPGDIRVDNQDSLTCLLGRSHSEKRLTFLMRIEQGNRDGFRSHAPMCGALETEGSFDAR